jgi:hypothetical protein
LQIGAERGRHWRICALGQWVGATSGDQTVADIAPHHDPIASDRALELARLAARDADPGHRAYLLQWAKVFQQLATLGQPKPNKGDES